MRERCKHDLACLVHRNPHLGQKLMRDGCGSTAKPVLEGGGVTDHAALREVLLAIIRPLGVATLHHSVEHAGFVPPKFSGAT